MRFVRHFVIYRALHSHLERYCCRLGVCRARSFDFHTYFVSLLKDEFLREENGTEKEGNGKIGKEKLKKNNFG